VQPDFLRDVLCNGWEERDPTFITSQSKWHIFKCKRQRSVWHVNGPSRGWDGVVMAINLDYSCGADAFAAMQRGWADIMPYTGQRVWRSYD
jgi:hypothetical protein